MAYKTHTQQLEVTAVDIRTMAKMSLDEYREYLRDGLIHVDHHDVLRSMAAGYPLAVTKEQFNALMTYLRELEPRVGEE